MEGSVVEAAIPDVPVIVVYRVGRTMLIVLVYAKSMYLAYCPTNALTDFTPSADMPCTISRKSLICIFVTEKSTPLIFSPFVNSVFTYHSVHVTADAVSTNDNVVWASRGSWVGRVRGLPAASRSEKLEMTEDTSAFAAATPAYSNASAEYMESIIICTIACEPRLATCRYFVLLITRLRVTTTGRSGDSVWYDAVPAAVSRMYFVARLLESNAVHCNLSACISRSHVLANELRGANGASASRMVFFHPS